MLFGLKNKTKLTIGDQNLKCYSPKKQKKKLVDKKCMVQSPVAFVFWNFPWFTPKHA